MLRALIVALMVTLAGPAALAQDARKTPYWASISAGEALMRAGPGRSYPAKWLYRRADLPIKILEVYPSWRRVQDHEGATGWMLVNLLSDTRTALVTGNEPRPLHVSPDAGAPVRYRAAPGVVGRLSRCDNGWCQLDVGGRQGFISVEHLYGVDPGENFE